MILFITCLFDLSPYDQKLGRRPINDYFEAGKKLLRLGINLIVFMDLTLRNQWENILNADCDTGRKCKVKTVYLNINDLPLWKDRDLFTRGRKPNLAGDKLSPEYFILIWSKFDLVSNVIADPQFSEFSNFIWLDFSISILTDDTDLHRLESFESLSSMVSEDTFKVCVYWTNLYPLCLNKEHTFDTVWSQTPAGFWMTNRKNFGRVYPIFKELSLGYLSEGKLVTEEDILTYMRCKYPELFTCFYGTYSSLIKSFCGDYSMNEWNLTQNLNNLRLSSKTSDQKEAQRLAIMTMKEIMANRFAVSNECFKLITDIISKYSF